MGSRGAMTALAILLTAPVVSEASSHAHTDAGLEHCVMASEPLQQALH